MTGQHRVMTHCRASSFKQCLTVHEMCKFFSDNTILVKVDQECFFMLHLQQMRGWTSLLSKGIYPSDYRTKTNCIIFRKVIPKKKKIQVEQIIPI